MRTCKGVIKVSVVDPGTALQGIGHDEMRVKIALVRWASAINAGRSFAIIYGYYTNTDIHPQRLFTVNRPIAN